MVKNAKKELDKIEEFVNKPKRKIVKTTEVPEVKKILPSLEFKGYTTEIITHKINWIGVFRKINRIGNELIVITISKSDIKSRYKKYWEEYCKWQKNFEIKCGKFWHNLKKLIYKIYVKDYCSYIEWVKYCIWWNININREVRKNGKN